MLAPLLANRHFVRESKLLDAQCSHDYSPAPSSHYWWSAHLHATGMGLELLATVESPEYGGVVLQATDVHWVGNTIYASYNVREDQFLGAFK